MHIAQNTLLWLPPPPIGVSAMCMVPALFNLLLLQAWRKQNFSFLHAYTRDGENNGMVCDTTRGLTSPVTRVDQLPPSNAQSLISNERDRAFVHANMPSAFRSPFCKHRVALHRKASRRNGSYVTAVQSRRFRMAPRLYIHIRLRGQLYISSRALSTTVPKLKRQHIAPARRKERQVHGVYV